MPKGRSGTWWKRGGGKRIIQVPLSLCERRKIPGKKVLELKSRGYADRNLLQEQME